MVYLEPPFHVIEGVSILSDHADPLQFYYLPLFPHLTVLEDSVAGVEIPQIQLIKYRGDAGNGGFLNFDVNLGIKQDHLEDIRRELRNLHDLDEDPRLAPVPLLDGAVKLMMLGRESGQIAETDPKFVVKMQHHAKPSLYGTNQASFSVQLDKAGVVVVEKALKGELAPIGVVYSLDYLALRPAYSVRVVADWDRIQKHLEESFGVDVIFFSAQIDNIVDELVENQAIVIEIDNFIPPGEDASELRGRLEQAVNEVKDMVLENFFAPSLDPIQREQEDDWDRAADFGNRMHRSAASGGLSETGFTYKKMDMTRIDKKRLSVNMTERTTVKRSIYPQAHLQGLFRILRDGNVDLDRFILTVDLDDEWFKKRRVKIISRANFDRDAVQSLNVKLSYQGRSQNVILDSGSPTADLVWNSVMRNGQMIRDLQASYTVHFKDVDSAERPLRLSSAKEEIDTDNYEIRPHELFSLVPINILGLDFPWKIYPHVEVKVKYSDELNNINIDDTFILEETKPEVKWNLFTMNPELNVFKYQLIYRGADHRDIEMPWVETDAEEITIRDPFPIKRKLQVVPAFRWSGVNVVFVDITYHDKENDVKEEYSLEFTAEDKKPKTIEVKRLKNPKYRFIDYKTIIIYDDGRVQEVPTSTTLDNRVILTPQMKGHKIITVRPSIASFEDNRIKEMEVLLKYEDANAGLSYMDSFKFRSHLDHPRYFEFDFADTQQRKYQYQVFYTHTNGLQRSTDWVSVQDDFLTVELT